MLIALACGSLLLLGLAWLGPGGFRAERALGDFARRAHPRDPAALCQAVSSAIEHGATPAVPASNWAMRLMASFGAVPNESQEPCVALEERRGLCHSAAALSVYVARSRGWSAHLVDLGEHVIAQVDAGGEAWIVDADFGVSAAGTAEGLVRDEALRERWLSTLRQAGASERSVAVIQRTLAVDDEGGSRLSVPRGLALSPRLAVLEKAASLFSRWGPLVTLFLALTLMRRRASSR